jgi:hypothetical protein
MDCGDAAAVGISGRPELNGHLLAWRCGMLQAICSAALYSLPALIIHAADLRAGAGMCVVSHHVAGMLSYVGW